MELSEEKTTWSHSTEKSEPQSSTHMIALEKDLAHYQKEWVRSQAFVEEMAQEILTSLTST